MNRLAEAVKGYWTSTESNIFKNCWDAVFGILPLVLLPLSSLLSVYWVSCATFWNYSFPIIAICLAGMYDAYGRMEPNRPANIKLGIRISMNLLSLLLSAVLLYSNIYIRLIPPAILSICGIALTREIWQRITTSIQMSEWYPN